MKCKICVYYGKPLCYLCGENVKEDGTCEDHEKDRIVYIYKQKKTVNMNRLQARLKEAK
jgi:hypothetical protein